MGRPHLLIGSQSDHAAMVPMALAGARSFRTVTPSLHTTTNIEVIGRFLDVDIRVTNETREDGPTRYLVRVGDDEL